MVMLMIMFMAYGLTRLCFVEEHESTLQKVKEEHLQKLEEDKKNKELSGFVSLWHFIELVLLLPVESQIHVIKCYTTSSAE